MIRTKWVDEDIAKALFPTRAAQVEDAVVDASLYSYNEGIDGDLAMDMPEWDRGRNGALNTIITHRRRRVRLIEAWYRLPEKVERIRGSAFNGQIFDENDPRHTEAVEAGKAVLVSKVMMRTRVAIMTNSDLLWDSPSPYRHNKFKFVPIWGYKRGRDGLPYGMIRSLRDCGALAHILPEVDRLFGVPQPAQHHPEIDTGEHVMMVIDHAAATAQPLAVRWACLLHDLGKGDTPAGILPHHKSLSAGIDVAGTGIGRFRTAGLEVRCDLVDRRFQRHQIAHDRASLPCFRSGRS